MKNRASDSYTIKLNETFNLIAYNNNFELIGSSAQPFVYANDYDLFNIVHSHSNLKTFISQILKKFKAMAQSIKRNKDIYFISFMCGLDDNNEPLNWSLDDIINHRVVKDKKTYDLHDLFIKKSVIKIDIVLFEDNQFIPLSNWYEFILNNKNLNSDGITLDTEKSLKKDIKKFKKKGNIMKALKRKYAMIKKSDPELSKSISDVFDSSVGRLYYVKNQLESIVSVLELYKDKATVKRSTMVLDKLKTYIGTQQIHNFYEPTYKKMNKIMKTRSIDKKIEMLNKLSSKLNAIVQKNVKAHIKTLKIKL